MAKRLSVNLDDEVAAALEEVASRRGVSITEALRHAISTEFFIGKQIEAGKRVLIADPTEDTVQQVEWPDD